MKLKEFEEIKGEYFFTDTDAIGLKRFFLPKSKRDSGIRSILTNKRLIFITKWGEEHYPLSKITAVSLEKSYKRSNIIGVSLFAFVLFLIPVIIRFAIGMKLATTGYIAYYIIISITILIEYHPKIAITNLNINHMGGNKTYSSVESLNLHEFIEKINETLMSPV